jgi:hypothetical protein
MKPKNSTDIGALLQGNAAALRQAGREQSAVELEAAIATAVAVRGKACARRDANARMDSDRGKVRK